MPWNTLRKNAWRDCDREAKHKLNLPLEVSHLAFDCWGAREANKLSGSLSPMKRTQSPQFLQGSSNLWATPNSSNTLYMPDTLSLEWCLLLIIARSLSYYQTIHIHLVYYLTPFVYTHTLLAPKLIITTDLNLQRFAKLNQNLAQSIMRIFFHLALSLTLGRQSGIHGRIDGWGAPEWFVWHTIHRRNETRRHFIDRAKKFPSHRFVSFFVCPWERSCSSFDTQTQTAPDCITGLKLRVSMMN